MSPKIHSYPVKEFFINTLTKDVNLDDCILDLLDNCIDGAKRVIADKGADITKLSIPFEGFRANISFNIEKFLIIDNCGGIPREYAVNYAFHFGKRPDAPADAQGLIGLDME